MKTTPKSAKEAYNIVAAFLFRKRNEVDLDTPEDVLEKYGDELESMVGRYSDAVDMMVRVYYNIEDFVADGEPMDQVWIDIENLAK